MNDNTNKQTHKLKLLKLNTLLSDEYLKTKDSNKTERTHPKSLQKLYSINYPKSVLHTQNNFHINLSKFNINNYKLEAVKKKPFRNNINLPFLLNERNKKKNNYNINTINTINSINGYNNYLKIKSNKAYMKINRILMEQTLKRLSKPKFRRAKRGERIWKEKSRSFSNEIVFEEDLYDEQKEKIKNKKKITKNSLYEKEKMRSRAKFKFLLKNNFRELDSCEKKFDIVIDKTMKLLSDYKNSLSYLKKEE